MTGEVYNEARSSLPEDGMAELSLTLENVVREQDGQKLVCEATTTYPPNMPPVTQTTALSVSCES